MWSVRYNQFLELVKELVDGMNMNNKVTELYWMSGGWTASSVFINYIRSHLLFLTILSRLRDRKLQGKQSGREANLQMQ